MSLILFFLLGLIIGGPLGWLLYRIKYPIGFTSKTLDCMLEWNDYRQTAERREIAEQGFARIDALLPPEEA